MDCFLGRLGPTEFEHLIQALAIAGLGISVSTVGAGPDARREATFDGKVVAPQGSTCTGNDAYVTVANSLVRLSQGIPALAAGQPVV